MRIFSLSKEQRLSEQAVLTLVIHAIYQFGNSLSLIFINLYLWRLTNDLFINGLFNLIAILTQGITTFLIGKYAKKKDRLIPYRYGIFLTALFYLCIILAQENIVHYFYLFAMLKGVSQALYWLGYFTLAHEVSNGQNRHRYLGWNQIVMSATNLSGPALAGFIISMNSELKGYIIVFSLAFFMFIVSTIGSLKIKKETVHHKDYYMKYLQLILKRKPKFFHSLLGWFIIGFPQGILMYIPSILLYNIFPDEQVVGYLNVAFLSLSIISSYMITRITNSKSTVKYLTISAFGFIFSSLFLFSEISIWTVVLFMSINSLFKPLQANAYAVHYFNWVDVLPLKENFRVESVVLRESIINLGRGLGIVIFMIFSKEINTVTVPWIIMTVMAIQLLIPYFAKEKW
ncbi:MFS transporter [Litchfieldia salsa]|uniref:MFS transporter, YQGE family, putative transporter n=1 Tax=Litchfieldia salsa TaxID=930152 RepID=A0A1H0PSH6_9BACI|nr:MFS transporter [Litchfieldia salsa]SDP07615.1 MFS transporter, YQGE family, putative transporter [Litchfieldia salsa]